MQNIFSQRFDEIESFVSERNQQSFRSDQIWKGLYQHFYNDWNAFSNLPLGFKEMLETKFSLVNIKLLDSRKSGDLRSEKLLYELNDGYLIESVILPNNKRTTLCISTQSGCPVGCVFCATGKMVLQRSLTSGEIIEQVVNYCRLSPDNYTNLGNIVLMGMGEPFLNYQNVINALRTLNNHHGLNIGARRITISTIGIVDKIRRFAQENFQVNLAVSLHAPTNEIREKLVPITKSNPIPEIIEACEYYYEMTRRRITFEYVMIDNVNDSQSQAEKLAELIGRLNCHVNLIPLNETAHYQGRRPKQDKIKKFERILINKRIPTSIRNSLGAEISAGCGQLAGQP